MLKNGVSEPIIHIDDTKLDEHKFESPNIVCDVSESTPTKNVYKKDTI